jgi:hypothetical protein
MTDTARGLEANTLTAEHKEARNMKLGRIDLDVGVGGHSRHLTADRSRPVPSETCQAAAGMSQRCQADIGSV